MKNKIPYAIIAILITIMIGIVIMVKNNIYPETAMITNIDAENNLITVTCGNGNMFSFYSESEDWICGDLCSLIMYNNRTVIVDDDKVIKSKYSGYLELFEVIAETN